MTVLLMADNERLRVLCHKTYKFSFFGRPEIYRSLEKFSPRQNDFTKIIVSTALHLENTYVTPKSIVIGGLLEPSQVNQVESFFSEETAVFAYVLTKRQMFEQLSARSRIPTVFIFASQEKSESIDEFRNLAMSLSRHSDQFSSKLLQRTYDYCKKKQSEGTGRGRYSLVIEEKFGKIAVLNPEEQSLKDRLKYFSRGGLDWRRANDDHAFFESGWSIGSFMVSDEHNETAKKAICIHIETLDIVIEHAQKPNITGLKCAADMIVDWIKTLKGKGCVPDLASVYYSIPSVPIVGWLSERIDLLLNRPLQHNCPALVWGWHPTADFTSFLAQKNEGASLHIEMDEFPRISATLRYGASDD
jgi:hypothetical protein